MPTARHLVDTGVLYAALAATDNRHEVCAPLLRAAHKPLLTTEAVIAELFWLIGTNRHFMRSGWQLVRSGAITLAEITDNDLLPLEALMLRYADRPMDLADACLVRMLELAVRCRIWTVDRADFTAYRRHGRQVIPCEFPA